MAAEPDPHFARLNDKIGALVQDEIRQSTSRADMIERMAALGMALTTQAGWLVGTMLHARIADQAGAEQCADMLQLRLREASADRMPAGFTVLHDLLRRTNETGRTDRHQQ